MKVFKTLQAEWLVALAIAMSGLAFEVHAAKVTLQWDPSPDSGVAGYKAYAMEFGFTQGGVIGFVSTNIVNVGNSTTATVDGLVEGQTYEFVVTAYSAAGTESEPSNDVTYSVPAAGPQYALQFGGFAHALVSYSPHGTMSASGETYAQGTAVILRATPATGYSCIGWTINSTFSAANPVTISMDRGTVATPVIQKVGSNTIDQPGTEISLTIGAVAGQPMVTVGGELGSWVLEGSTTVTTGWTQVATGLTSTQLPLSPSGAHAFYRVRSNPLTPPQ